MATYTCSACGATVPAQRFQCPECKSFRGVKKADGSKTAVSDKIVAPDGTMTLDQVDGIELERIDTGFRTINALFGGGAVVGATYLIGGGPGAGKSTLSLNLADIFAVARGKPSLYVAAEENPLMIKDRAARIGVKNLDAIRIFPMTVISSGQTDLLTCMKTHGIGTVIVDSVKAFCGSDMRGAVELCMGLKTVVDELQAIGIIIDQVNKAGDFAGFKELEHTVDWTGMITKTEDGEIRDFRVEKNRFGPANMSRELLMTEKGLIEAKLDDEGMELDLRDSAEFREWLKKQEGIDLDALEAEEEEGDDEYEEEEEEEEEEPVRARVNRRGAKR